MAYLGPGGSSGILLTRFTCSLNFVTVALPDIEF